MYGQVVTRIGNTCNFLQSVYNPCDKAYAESQTVPLMNICLILLYIRDYNCLAIRNFLVVIFAPKYSNGHIYFY